jgi:hypothetical protein
VRSRSACHPWRVDHDEYPGEEEAFVRHLDALGVPHHFGSPDARRLGLDRNTEEGALIAFSSSLRPNNPVHRVVAWILLAAFGIPALVALLHLTGALLLLAMP